MVKDQLCRDVEDDPSPQTNICVTLHIRGISNQGIVLGQLDFAGLALGSFNESTAAALVLLAMMHGESSCEQGSTYVDEVVVANIHRRLDTWQGLTVGELLAWKLDVFFGCVANAFQLRLLRIAQKMCQNSQMAEDVVQDVLAKAYASMREFTHEQLCNLKVYPWMCTILRNMMNNKLAREQRCEVCDPLDIEALEMVDVRHEQPEQVLLRQEVVAALKNLLQSMEGKDRQLLKLRYIDQLSHEDIARQCQLSAGNVRTRISRILTRLGKIIHTYGIEKDDLALW